ncbi:MAG: DUF1292 domain-containing protein [Blautia sp.]|nr:DUF1292 domain-containing protein [Blautia sp.]
MSDEKTNVNDYEEVELDAITLTLDDGTEQEFAIVAVFDLGDRDYCAICPIVDGDIVDEESITFFRYSEDGEEVTLDEIEDEDEYARVAQEYDILGEDDEAED